VSDELILDSAVLQRLRRLASPSRPTLLKDLLRSFEAGSAKGIEALRLALARGDEEAIRREAHSLKGSCQNLGANELARILASVEAAPGGAATEHAVMRASQELPRVCAAFARFAHSHVG
jgi:HPt (histidine-containing phosphotransfer) domain-containing protein